MCKPGSTATGNRDSLSSFISAHHLTHRSAQSPLVTVSTLPSAFFVPFLPFSLSPLPRQAHGPWPLPALDELDHRPPSASAMNLIFSNSIIKPDTHPAPLPRETKPVNCGFMRCLVHPFDIRDVVLGGWFLSVINDQNVNSFFTPTLFKA